MGCCSFFEFWRISFVWYSFWHSNTPHLLDSIPYCLTNGVQFNSDVLLPSSSYSGSTTISVANIKNVIKKYSPSARVNGLNKEKLLQLLEDIRKNNNITNADLCNKFADEIYLPKIVLKKADIPLSLRSQFIDLR